METISKASLRGTIALQHSEALFDAVVQTFAATCGTQLQVRQATADTARVSGVAAIVSMTGDVGWSAFLGLPAEGGAEIISRFTKSPIPYDSDAMDDATGTLGRLIGEQAKATLDALHVTADLSFPAVCRIDDFAAFIRNSGTAEFRCYRSQTGDVWAGVIAGL